MNPLAAVFEVVVVALAGSFITQFGFSLCKVSPGQVLTQTSLLFIFMVSEATLSLFILTLFLKARGEDLARIGLGWGNFRKEAFLGLATVPILFGATSLVGVFFHLALPQYVSTTNPLLELLRDEVDFLFFLTSSLYVGGFKEEVQRAFVLVRFERYLGFKIAGFSKENCGITLGLILWSIFFGAGHYLQGGIDKAAGAGVLGLLFGILYVWRRSLIAPMISHAAFDITTLLLFWFFMRGELEGGIDGPGLVGLLIERFNCDLSRSLLGFLL